VSFCLQGDTVKILIPGAVRDELNLHKNGGGEMADSARKIFRWMEHEKFAGFLKYQDVATECFCGAKLNPARRCSCQETKGRLNPGQLSKQYADDRIVECARDKLKEAPYKCMILTGDRDVAITAAATDGRGVVEQMKLTELQRFLGSPTCKGGLYRAMPSGVVPNGCDFRRLPIEPDNKTKADIRRWITELIEESGASCSRGGSSGVR
jgi:hypothetical protein